MKRTSVFILLALILLSIKELHAQQLKSFEVEFNMYSRDFNLSKWVKQYLGDDIDINPLDMHKSRGTLLENLGWEHYKVSQYYKGIPIEYSSISVHKKDGFIVSIDGNYFPNMNITTSPTISNEYALSKAIEYVGATRYSWEDTSTFLSMIDGAEQLYEKPVPILVICPNVIERTMEPTLAYKVELFSTQPFSHQYVYVDAQDASIVYVHKVAKAAIGLAYTKYSGVRPISTMPHNGEYVLIDATRGDSIKTCSYDFQGWLFFLRDDDNFWTSTEYHNAYKFDAALDVHWGSMKTYDYFQEKFGRNGIDGAGLQIKNFVNYPDVGANAYWDTRYKSMFYGSGDDYLYDAFVSIDIVAHELGHGITDSYQPNMIYDGESGALNESLSDIWGACVENYAAPEKQHWRMGEEPCYTNEPLRYFDYPRYGHQPSVYMGSYYLHPGMSSPDSIVHFNSGVPNHWFYLLSEGGAGVNELNYSYDIEGVGISAAADIVYESLNYLQDNISFMQYAAQTKKVAINMFGLCSTEVRSVIEAWKAVGVPIEDIPDTLNIIQTINNGISKRHYADSLIIASNIVRSGASAYYESIHTIKFLPGFQAEYGSLVEAKISDCEASLSNNLTMQAPDATLLYTDVEDKKSSSVKIKPNPVVESLGVEGLNNEEVSFAIYDSMGKLVRIGMIFAPYQIGVSDLQRGTYILRLYDGGNFIYLKFIKE